MSENPLISQVPVIKMSQTSELQEFLLSNSRAVTCLGGGTADFRFDTSENMHISDKMCFELHQ